MTTYTYTPIDPAGSIETIVEGINTIGIPRGRPLALGTMATRAWDHAETPRAKAVARDIALDLVQAAQAGAGAGGKASRDCIF